MERSDISVKPSENKEITGDNKMSQDIIALEKEFGQMYSGKVIDIELHDLLEICPRKRKKSDAFYALRKELTSMYGVELNIKSKKL